MLQVLFAKFSMLFIRYLSSDREVGYTTLSHIPGIQTNRVSQCFFQIICYEIGIKTVPTPMKKPLMIYILNPTIF
ncbi:unnamed protein product [Moneuplotes crassus]|uniref:Uncharacterized protein n=1 Tax=Euplotes crassus TaxID=5936 RepID=A0AAD1UG84_EUPCR|nr:unnamed protein product [Moneuplotes crassus]